MLLMIAAVRRISGVYEKTIHKERYAHKECTHPGSKQDQRAEVARRQRICGGHGECGVVVGGHIDDDSHFTIDI